MVVKIGTIIAALNSRSESEGAIVFTLQDQNDLKALVDALHDSGQLEVYEDADCTHMTACYRWQRLTRATIWAGTDEAELAFVTEDIPQLEADALRTQNELLMECLMEMSEIVYQ